MANRSIELSDQLYEYLVATSVRDTRVLARLREETARMPLAEMQIGPEQGQFMRLLVELIGARRALEVGVFTGYSALSVAMALPDDGTLIACDVSEEYTNVAKRYWEEAGVAQKIDLRLGPASDTLNALLASGEGGKFDFAFIDADKGAYDEYYELCLKLVRPCGLIALDNMFFGGAVIDPEMDNDWVQAVRDLNAKLSTDERVSLSLVPIGDGLSLCRKRA